MENKMDYKKSELTRFAKDCAWGSHQLINGACLIEEFTESDEQEFHCICGIQDNDRTEFKDGSLGCLLHYTAIKRAIENDSEMTTNLTWNWTGGSFLRDWKVISKIKKEQMIKSSEEFQSFFVL